MPIRLNAPVVAAARSRLEQFPQDVLSVMTAELVQATPVREGWLRAWWSCSVDGAAIDDSKPGEPDPTGTATVARLQDAIQAMKLGGTVRLVNAAPYAQRIEYGWSKQAPAGMVRITAARMPAIVAEVVARGSTTP